MHIRAPMHATFFGMKRAFQSSLKISRKLFLPFGLTPARFDMLYAILTTPHRTILQAELCRRLGVSRPTVSRMLKSLEDLNLVARLTRPPDDWRQRWVTLTTEGLTRIRNAISDAISSGIAQFTVDRALTHKCWDKDACQNAMNHFHAFLDRIRRSFQDSGSLHYPWRKNEANRPPGRTMPPT